MTGASNQSAEIGSGTVITTKKALADEIDPQGVTHYFAEVTFDSSIGVG